MKIPRAVVLMLGLAVAVPGARVPAACAAEPMRPGLWEITITMSMPGMPMAMPAMTQTHCYTKEDADDAKKLVPRGPREGEDCTLTDSTVVGNRVTWNVRCREGSGSGEMVLQGDSYEGTMRFTSHDSRGRERQMTQQIKGRRLGECR